MFYTGVKKMNNKIFIILFFLFALISVSAVSAADADGDNERLFHQLMRRYFPLQMMLMQ